MLKSWYEGHDQIYVINKQNGLPGWGTKEEIDETINAIKKFLSFQNIPKTGRVIELGCGSGDASIWLSKEGYEAFGTDISETAIKWAEEKAVEENATCKFILDNVADLNNFENDSFEIAIDSLCFHCIVGDDRQKFLKNVYRILKPNGFFMVRTMCGEPSNHIKETFHSETRTIMYKEYNTRYLGYPDDILNEVKDAGFNILFSEVLAAIDDNDQANLIIYAGK